MISAAFSAQRVRLEWRVVASLLVAVAAASAFGNVFERADLSLYDRALSLWQRPAPKDLVIVAVDEESIGQVGRWPWPRGVHSLLLQRLTRDGARAVALDVLFTEPDTANPDSDQALQAALRANGRTVLPVVETHVPGGPGFGLLPIAPLAQEARKLGYAQAEIDADGMVRRILPQRQVGPETYPNLALALVAVATGVPQSPAAPRWPTLSAGSHYIAFAGPPGHFHQIPYADVLRGNIPDGYFRDKIVLVGATAAGLGDMHPTPLSGGDHRMSGVEVLANVLDAQRLGLRIDRLTPAATAVLSGLTLVLLMLALRRSNARSGLLWSAAAALATLLLSAVLLRAAGLWYSPVPLLVGCALAYPLWSWRRMEAAQSYLNAELDLLAREPAWFAEPAAAITDHDPWERRIEAVREAAEMRRRARRFLSTALDSLPVGVLVTNAAQKVVIANRRAVDLLGADQQPLVGEELAQVLRRLRLPAQPGVEELLESVRGSILPRQVEAHRDDDHPILLGVAASDDDLHHSAGFVVSLSDVAELRRAQAAREKTMRFLSHDLRSPLMSIISMIDIMKDPQEGQTFDLDTVQQLARRALNLADDVMRLARAEGLDAQRFRPVDLVVLGVQAAEEVETLGLSRGVVVRFESGESAGAAFAQGDADLLRRALINLLNNAVRHSPDREQVTLSLRRHGEEWVMDVSDHGPGIPVEHMPKLFSPYASFAGRGEAGTGLGLVIVKTVVERHGGSISVRSSAAQGTRFEIRLPAAPGGTPAAN